MMRYKLLFLFLLFLSIIPASAETFSSSEVTSASTTPLSNDSYILAWSDYPTTNNKYFKIMWTNGTARVDTTSIGVSGYAISTMLDVVALNNTHWVYAYRNQDTSVLYAKLFNVGNLITTLTIDATMGVGSYSVSIDAANETRWGVTWQDDTTDELKFALYDYDTLVGSEVVVASIPYGDAQDIFFFNDTHHGVVWKNRTSNYISVAIYNGTTQIGSTFDVEWVGISKAVKGAAITDNIYAVAYYDEGEDDISFNTYYLNGTAISGIIDVEQNAGESANSVGLARKNSTHIYIAINGDVANIMYLGLYNIDGTVVYKLDKGTIGYDNIDIASSKHATGIGLVDESVVMMWVESASKSVYNYYNADGTLYSSVSNPVSLTNTTGNFYVNYSWAAGSGSNTDSFNVSQNGTWVNGSVATFNNSSVGAHGYSEIVVYAWNNTDRFLSLSYLTDNITVPNNIPVLLNVSISPELCSSADNLTANNGTVTDADNDVITFYYRWYKDGVLQTALNDIKVILSDNTTNDEIWKVGVIPNDGYENGSEVLSATITIGSGNHVPILSGITTNVSSKKYNQSVLVSSVDAFDQNDDNYTLHVGSATGLSDICNSSSTVNGSEATCDFLIPWTTGSHTLYGRLTDQNDTSIEYTIVITVDTTPPVLGANSVSPTSLTNDESTTISAGITVANGTVSWATVKIRGHDFTSTNYTLVNDNGTWTYVFSPAAAGSYLITNFYASDDSGNIMSESVSLPFEVVTGSEGSGGGGGGGGGDINITVVGDLILTPDRRDTYFFYTALSGEQVGVYRFIANRNIESCTVEPNDYTSCEIVDNYIVLVSVAINESTKTYDGELTIKDKDGYVATSSLVVRVIKIWGAIPIGSINVGPFAEILKVLFEVSGTAIIGVRTWFVLGVVGLFGYTSYRAYTS